MNAAKRRERRVARVLDALQLQDVAELTVFTESELRYLPRVGTVTVEEIRERLTKRGLSFLQLGVHRPMPDAIRAVFTRRREAAQRRGGS